MKGVYVVIPVFGAMQDTVVCLESVRKYSGDTKVYVIDDGSPDPNLKAFLDSFSETHPQFEVVRNPVNLGFVKCANLGFRLEAEKDIILLNSDTIVTSHWVEKLTAWAYCQENVATVTPFSNNATILSYPMICQENPTAEGLCADDINSLFEAVAGWYAKEVVEIPTGIGCCLYLRRHFLDKVGFFNESLFGKGYGEENDYCLRSTRLGGRHLVAVDTFILHRDGMSFGKSQKAEKTTRAVQAVNSLHPGYDQQVQAFIEADPLWTVRRRVDLLRYLKYSKPGVLLVDHGLGGGTRVHVRELCRIFSKKGWRPFILEPCLERGVVLFAGWDGEEFRLIFDVKDFLELLVKTLRALRVGHIHFHHIQGHPNDILRLPEKGSFSYDFTFHDYYMICPRITGFREKRNDFCGFDPGNDCHGCLAENNGFSEIDINEWRKRHGKWLTSARKLISPSESAAAVLKRYYPFLDIEIQPHPESFPFEEPTRENRPAKRLNVGIIGGVSPQKGRKVLEDCVRITEERELPIRWVLMGVTDREDRRDTEHFIITGPYEPTDLPGFIDKYDINVIVLPALWPETYSFVLSESWRLGRPVIAPEIGAFKERMESVGAGILLPSPITAERIIETLLRLKAEPADFYRWVSKIHRYRGRDPLEYWETVYRELSGPGEAYSGEESVSISLERLIALNQKKRNLEWSTRLTRDLMLTRNHAENLTSINRDMGAHLENLKQSLELTDVHVRNLLSIKETLESNLKSLAEVNAGHEKQIAMLNGILRKYKIHWVIRMKTVLKRLFSINIRPAPKP